MIAAVEDVLSEAVVRKLMAEMHPDLSITTVGMRGRGYLQKKSRDLNRTARSTPVLILVDLDDPEPCPADLITDFLRARPAHNLVFRVAVMEIESWIIADREAFASFVGVPSYRIPTNTDTIFDPKEFVVNLARRSRRRGIRQDLVPDPDGTAAVGLCSTHGSRRSSPWSGVSHVRYMDPQVFVVPPSDWSRLSAGGADSRTSSPGRQSQ